MRDLSQALDQLKAELKAMARGERAFLAHYRRARLYAFQIEFIAKFMRKSLPANLEIYERLQSTAKDLEDRLGEFNELDELLAHCEQRGLIYVAELKSKRTQAYVALAKWTAAWAKEMPAKIAALISQLEPLGPREQREAAIKKMAKVCRELQDNVDDGAYDPRKKSGYTMGEVEPKVHELRREIRKIPMYAGYLKGQFALSDRVPATKAFRPLCQTSLARSAFAKLPKAGSHPILIPRADFLALTKYVSELGGAKDWAQNLERLRECGAVGQISFDQLDVSLKNQFGQPLPFNTLTRNTIREIRETQIFRRLAEGFESQR